MKQVLPRDGTSGPLSRSQQKAVVALARVASADKPRQAAPSRPHIPRHSPYPRECVIRGKTRFPRSAADGRDSRPLRSRVACSNGVWARSSDSNRADAAKKSRAQVVGRSARGAVAIRALRAWLAPLTGRCRASLAERRSGLQCVAAEGLRPDAITPISPEPSLYWPALATPRPRYSGSTCSMSTPDRASQRSRPPGRRRSIAQPLVGAYVHDSM